MTRQGGKSRQPFGRFSMSQNNLINEFINAAPQALLDTKIVAAYTGLSISWFHCKAVSGGGIPYTKIGNKRRYLKQDVLDWLAEHTKKVHSTSEYIREGGCDE